MGKRQEKMNELLARLAAQFFSVSSGTHSLITVTRVSTSSDFKKATVYFTVIPTDKENDALLFANRKRSDLREYVKKHTNLKFLPFFDIEIDINEKNRQKIDTLLEIKK